MKPIDIDQYYKMYESDETMKEDIEPCSYRQLFTFADYIDIILMIVGTGMALGTGVSLIFYARPFGQLVDAFSGIDREKIVQDTLSSVYAFLQNSAIVFVLSWFSTTIWMVTSERQMIKARKQYFGSLMRQQAAWHDRNKPGQVCSRMYIQIGKVHQALVNNVTSVLTKLSLGVSGIVISVTRGWRMAVVMIAFLPLMSVAAFAATYYYKRSQKYMQRVKAKIDSEVIEVFQNIRTVKTLGGEKFQTDRFTQKINKVTTDLSGNAIKSKIAFAAFFFSILMNYAIGFFYGAKLVSDKTINDSSNHIYVASDVIIIFFTLYVANLSLSGLPQTFATFNVSRLSMKRIMLIVNRQSKVKEGIYFLPPRIDEIEFKNVRFRYEKSLFQNFNLKITKGVTAIIGESGSGKTTIINLIMRFYDVFSGSITFNFQGKGYNLNTFRFQSLRSRVGYVGQQPVLIGKTIREVIGAENLSDNQIQQVLTKVQAWKFVEKIGIDNQYSSLSGGQKQRIAIARALIKKPDVLILDEGTSALDRRTQQIVLKAIKKSDINFVIMIAHRTQSIINADRIIKVEKGIIVNDGNYQHLVREKAIERSDIQISPQKEKQEIHKQMETQQQLQNNQTNTKLIHVVQMIEQKQKENQKDQNQMGADKQFKMGYICRLMRKNGSKWYLYVLGIFGACYIGAVFPVFALILSNIIVILSGIERVIDSQLPAYQQKVNYLSIGMFMLSLSSLFIIAIKGVSFSILTESLGNYLKRSSYRVGITKSMEEVDEIGKQSLAHVVNANCDDLKDLGGNHLGDIFQNLTTIVVGLGIAFAYCWQITLVALGIFPLILISGKIQMSFNQGLSSQTDTVHKKTHELVIETIINNKTVRSLNVQEKILNKYSQSLDGALFLSIRNGNLAGIMFGFAQSLISTMLALIFFVGSILIRSNISDILSIYTAIYAIMFAGVQAGGNLGFLAKLAGAKYAACNYFELIQDSRFSQEKTDLINKSQRNLIQIELKTTNLNNKIVQGEIFISNMTFKYPKRQIPIFKNFNLKIRKGQRVALVGESGSGKSSIANILFRLYDPSEGQINIDGQNIKKYSLSQLKTWLGIVSQQPVLFNRSVYENIKYNMENVTFQDVIKASKQANAFEFICQGNFGMKQTDDCEINQMQRVQISLDGFKKSVGTKGSYLSGGQKQRIAIARALIRNPVIMVLDEATSALDNANQKAVQEAIEKIKGITQIIIAHRLSTIENCDRIVVMGDGKILQQGGYHQLLQKKGQFFKLVNAIAK